MISSHAPPRTFVKSRENLQELSKNSKLLEKFAAFDSVLNAIWYKIRPGNHLSSPTTCTIDLISLRLTHSITDEFISELIPILKKEYPGVDFAYKATTGYHGMILEQIIIMDWS